MIPKSSQYSIRNEYLYKTTHICINTFQKNECLCICYKRKRENKSNVSEVCAGIQVMIVPQVVVQRLSVCSTCLYCCTDKRCGRTPAWLSNAVMSSPSCSVVHHNSSRSSKSSSSGKSPTVTACGFTKPPYFGRHSKYLFPEKLKTSHNKEAE